MSLKYPTFIPVSMPYIAEREIEYVTAAVKSGWVSSLGEYIDKFEHGFAKFCDVKHAIAVSNGTTGLHLALVACGVKAGDEVIVPDLSFIATANVIVHAGATPVFVDIEADTLCMDPEKFRAAITPKTKAVMPVHLYGHPANMKRINQIAAEHGIIVIEDAAEAHGALADGKKVGSLGKCGVFSFYGNKIITSGEGGMITTNDDALAEYLRNLRDHAMSKTKRYWHEYIGYNYRMTNLQAALGFAQLEKINDFIEKRHDIYRQYSQHLKDVPGVRLNYKAPWAEPVHWMVCLEYEGFNENNRAEFMKLLKERNVDSRPYFYAMSDMPMYKQANTPVSHKMSMRGINLPTYTTITNEEIKFASEAIKDILKKI